MDVIPTAIYKGYVYEISEGGKFVYIQTTKLNGDPEHHTEFIIPRTDFKGEDFEKVREGSLVELRIGPSKCEALVEDRVWTQEELDVAKRKTEELSAFLDLGREEE